jgi:antitoxin component YwqK of YwqJK toxin-antitoxin module
MKRFFVLGFVACFGCASGGPKVVSGGLIDAEGWPYRKAEAQYRCPDGTYVDDLTLADGRRDVTCKRVGLPRSLGFQLQWSNAGSLDMRTEFDPDGLPVSRKRWFEDGTLKSVESFVQGATQSREVWFPTGVLQEQVIRDGNLLHVTRYQPDAEIEAEGTLENEVKTGPWTLWREGAIEKVGFVQGLEQGPAKRVFVDKTIETGAYVDGKKQGVWSRRTETGLDVRDENYAYGVLDGRFSAFHPNQAPAITGQYAKGEKAGSWATYHPNAQHKSRGAYFCGKEHGPWTVWHSNGQISQQGEYIDGVKVGEWNTFAEDGTLLKVDTFQTFESTCPAAAPVVKPEAAAPKTGK